MANDQNLSASLEDYLEAIYHVEVKKQAARATDISRRLGVRSSSVTGALRALAERDLVNYAPYDLITLTAAGRRLAKDVVRRHEVLRDFFIRILGVAQDQAEDSACKVEHAIPKPIMDRLTRFLSFVESCPRGGPDWLKGFERHCERDGVHDDCERCIAQCLQEVKGKLSASTEHTS